LYEVHPTQIKQWKGFVLEKIDGIFSEKDRRAEREREGLIEELYQQIGKLKVEIYNGPQKLDHLLR
jgi:hypothetical protein